MDFHDKFVLDSCTHIHRLHQHFMAWPGNSLSKSPMKMTTVLLISIVSIIALSCPLSDAAINMRNSPIYYIHPPVMRLPSHSSSRLVLNQYGRPYAISQLYRLPIQFLSNAKPVEVIRGNPFAFNCIYKTNLISLETH